MYDNSAPHFPSSFSLGDCNTNRVWQLIKRANFEDYNQKVVTLQHEWLNYGKYKLTFIGRS